MKLKNRKTGEIKEVEIRTNEYNRITIVGKMEDGVTDFVMRGYNSLKELADEWEDYEETKIYWCIDAWGDISKGDPNTSCYIDSKKSIGNYFLRIEEAELAVRKLQAWKRLKDKGIKFYGWNGDTGTIRFDILGLDYWAGNKDVIEDLQTVFGGEE